jgi:aminoglycoside 6'-N-acetyltransferase I
LKRAPLAEVRIRRLIPGDRAAWLQMRHALWPAERGQRTHARDIDAFFAGQSVTLDAVLIADARGVGPVGFLELRVRNYAEGSDSHAVPHIEGWYVEAEYRRRRIGARLLAAAERWARSAGYAELASDASIDNAASIAAHRALGFELTERIVCFLKKLGSTSS